MTCAGTGPVPTLVLLPGLHGTRELFKPLLAEMPKGLATRLVDYPTDRPLGRIELLRHLEEQLGDLSEMVLLAESFSGPLAIQFAASHPGRVKALVLCVSFISPPVPRILCYLATVPVLLRCPLPTVGIRM